MPAWLFFALLISLVLAFLYQIVNGRFGWRVTVYWICIVAGFLGAEAIADGMGWGFSRFGDLRLLPDIFGACLVLGALRVLDL